MSSCVAMYVAFRSSPADTGETWGNRRSRVLGVQGFAAVMSGGDHGMNVRERAGDRGTPVSSYAVPRVSVVTGAASGIGRATALLLAERGDVVVGLDRNPEGLAETRAADTSGRLETATVDVTHGDAVRARIDDVASRHGGLHVLVTAAAIGL